MRCTFILKGFSSEFYEGSGSIVGLATLNDEQKWEKLVRLANDKRIPMKAGSGQFRDLVELNSIIKGPHSISIQLAPRKGYNLAIAEVNKI